MRPIGNGASVQVNPLASSPVQAAPGKLVKLTVPVLLRPGSEDAVPAISLLDRTGTVARRFVKRVPADGPGLAAQVAPSGLHGDPWQFFLPDDMAEGTYRLRYELAGTATEIGLLTVSRQAGLSVGQHFHRIPGTSEDGPVLVPHHFVRSLNSDLVGAVQWWTGAKTRCEAQSPGHCADTSDEDWRDFDRWADYHARPGERRLLVTFSGSPAWASARPREASPYCDACGLIAEPAARYLPAYRRMVAATVARYRDRLLGVECWNEPYFDDAGKPRPSSYFTGTPTSLADVCKAIHSATKSVAPEVLVFCPQAPSPAGMANVLQARTSAGEPIHAFCDVIGAHAYNAVGADREGRDFGASRIADSVRVMRAIAERMKLDKPIAITEWGIDKEFRLAPPRSGSFASMNALERGEMIYQTLATLQELGVGWIGLYSYDSDLEGIWQGIDPVTRRPRYDAVLARRLAEAVKDIGKPTGP